MDTIRITKVDQVRLNRLSHQFGGPSSPAPDPAGSLHLTTHHIIWKPPTDLDPSPKSPCQTVFDKPGNHEVWITHALLSAIEHLPAHPQPTLLIRLITFVTYTLSFPSPSVLEDVWDSLKALVASRKQGDKHATYAFTSALPSLNPSSAALPGWDTYDPIREFSRLKAIGPDETAWRITSINSDFNFCSTYPPTLLVPAKISDTTLSYAVKYRSKGRLPVGTYVHWANGSSITRSSQPMVGFKNARSIQDEKLIEAIFHSHSLHTGPRTSTIPAPVIKADQPTQQVVYGATSTNLIIDARPTTNAMANTVKGAGTENMENYKGCRKAYLGIDNIHVMRDSLNKVVTALHESFVSGQPISQESLRRSGWLKHSTAVLDGTNQITRTVHISNSHVLIHCSDGWDRTSQLSALSQVCLDPYYRTFTGFAVLIEKDWLSFGHKFSDRSGIVVSGKEMVSFGSGPPTSSSSDSDGSEPSASSAWVTSFQKQLNFGSSTGHSHAFKETSPVFHQFLDCVYQLQRQFPTRFEFNASYLQRLHEELYSGQYGTFLFDSEAERISFKAKSRTRSVWELFETDRTRYRNTAYDPGLDDPSRRANEDQGVLLPDPKDVVFWWELFGIENESINPPKQPLPVAAVQDLNGPSTSSSSLPRSSSARVDRSSNRLETETEPRARAQTLIPEQMPRLPSYLTAPLNRGNNEADTTSVVGMGGGDPIQAVFQTAKTVGWNTWDRLRRGYEEATKVSDTSSEWEEESDDRLRAVSEPPVGFTTASEIGIPLGCENPWRVNDSQREKDTVSGVGNNVVGDDAAGGERLVEQQQQNHRDPWGSSDTVVVVDEIRSGNANGNGNDDPLRVVQTQLDPLGVGLL